MVNTHHCYHQYLEIDIFFFFLICEQWSAHVPTKRSFTFIPHLPKIKCEAYIKFKCQILSSTCTCVIEWLYSNRWVMKEGLQVMDSAFESLHQHNSVACNPESKKNSKGVWIDTSHYKSATLYHLADKCGLCTKPVGKNIKNRLSLSSNH